MFNARYGLLAVALTAILGASQAAQANCSYHVATYSCLQPLHPPVPSTSEPTSATARALSTVGTPGLYGNWGNGYDVRVYLGGNGTGYQAFPWQAHE